MLIKGGTVYLEDGPRRANVLVVDGLVAGILDGDADDPAVIDATGCAVVPGMIDIHVHADDVIGGVALADSYASASQAAVLTGVTTICGFATQWRGRTLDQAVEAAIERAGRGSYCDTSFHLTPTSFSEADWQRIERLSRRGFGTLKLYTTYRKAGLYTSYGSMRDVLERCADLGMGVLVHCEDHAVLDTAARGGFDPSDPYAHALLRPPEAEEAAVRKVAEIAARTGAHVHVVHVSSAATAEVIQELDATCNVTCETAPQYLLLDDGRLGGEAGHRFLCTPPLRSAEDRLRMVELAGEGAFDCLATDHCAYLRKDKDRFDGNIENVPKGLAGIGALVPAGLEVLGDLEEVVSRLALNPARVVGLYPRKGAIREGSDADIVVLRTDGPARPVRSSLSDAYEPYAGMTTSLDVRAVLLRGEPVVREGRIAARPSGISIAR